MKRHTQTQQPTSGRAPLSADTPSELVRSAQTAAALIELAISESLQPVEALGAALTRISAAEVSGAPPQARDVSTCIESLQFHDRLTQQLTQVRDLLANVTADEVAGVGALDWPALRESLRSRFTSESHRMLFNLLLPDEVGHGHIGLHADEGSVELF